MTSTTKNTIPAAGASFLADLQTFLREEEPDRFRDMFTGFIVSGGTHVTGGGLVHTPASLTAYPGGHYITETGAITYPDATTHIWVICHKDTTTAVTDWTRVSGTHYLFRNTGSGTKPTLPVVESAILMKVTTSGGAVTVVDDHRELAPVAELTSDIDTGAVFNESGLADYDFRIESDSNTHKLFLDAGTNELQTRPGTSTTDFANIGGMLSMQTTGIGTDAGTAEKDLLTYTLPANALSIDGQSVKIRVWGTTAANANTKRARLSWGGLIIADSTALAANNKDWFIETVVIRTGSSAQDIYSPDIQFNNLRSAESNFVTDTESLTTATIIKITGQNGTATANDIIAQGMSVEYFS